VLRHHARIPNVLIAEMRGKWLPIVLYAWLSGRYGGFKDGIYPSVPTRAAELGCSERMVQRYIDTLVRSGWLIVSYRKDASSVYGLITDGKSCSTHSQDGKCQPGSGDIGDTRW
jgi:DNA-binding transcriptional regulator PaaX